MPGARDGKYIVWEESTQCLRRLQYAILVLLALGSLLDAATAGQRWVYQNPFGEQATMVQLYASNRTLCIGAVNYADGSSGAAG